jgi:hypothetical protein
MFSQTCRSSLFLTFPVSTPAVQPGLSILSSPERSVSGFNSRLFSLGCYSSPIPNFPIKNSTVRSTLPLLSSPELSCLNSSCSALNFHVKDSNVQSNLPILFIPELPRLNSGCSARVVTPFQSWTFRLRFSCSVRAATPPGPSLLHHARRFTLQYVLKFVCVQHWLFKQSTERHDTDWCKYVAQNWHKGHARYFRSGSSSHYGCCSFLQVP